MKFSKTQNSQDMIASAERIDRLGSKRFATDTNDQRLNDLIREVKSEINEECGVEVQ